MKSAAVPLAFLILLAFVPVAHASPPSNQLNLEFSGSIDSSGQQAYTQSGGDLLAAFIDGQQVDTSTADFAESVSASVDGLVTSGTATFSLSGGFLCAPTPCTETSFSTGDTIDISDAIPAEAFPVGAPCAWDGVTLPLPAGCTSQVPAFFFGTGTLDVPGWYLESAFLNPFGGPIVWASTDDSVVLVFTYDAAAIDWADVQTSGSLTGTLGTTPVTGSFTQTTSAHEDLFAGTETESGTLTFLGMTPSSLDATGPYSGSSTIPTSGEIDCSAVTTQIAGTCTETGFSSAGEFTLDPGHTLIQGTYDIAWAVPALSFSGPSTATVSQTTTGVPEFPSGLLAALMVGLPLLLAVRQKRFSRRKQAATSSRYAKCS